MHSSRINVAPASPNFPSKDSFIAALVSFIELQTVTPLPDARPSALTTNGLSISETRSCASFSVLADQCCAVGIFAPYVPIIVSLLLSTTSS